MMERIGAALTGVPSQPVTNTAAIQAAIAAANHTVNGVDFGPFLINTDSGWDVTGSWMSERGDNPITFFFDAPDLGEPGFHTLGGTVTLAGGAPRRLYVAPHPGNQAGLAVPASFDWVLDDKGSGNRDSVDYFWPTPPVGYQGIGICFAGWADPDNANPPTSYCVADSALEPGVATPCWSDAGQGWSHHSGNLSKVTLADLPPDNKMRIAPGTCLSDEATKSGTFGCAPWTLVGQQMLLPVKGSSTQYPGPNNPYDAPFLHAVVVLPSIGIEDPVPNTLSPFYYLSAESMWWLVGSNDPEYPSNTTTYSIYHEPTTEADLCAATGLTIGPKSGVVIPASANGVISLSLNDAFHIMSDLQPTDAPIDVPIPAGVIAQGAPFVQRAVQLTLWRSDGSIAAQAVYHAADIRSVSTLPHG